MEGVETQLQLFLTSALVGGVVNFRFRPLYPGYLLQGRPGGSQSQSRHCGRKNSLAPAGNSGRKTTKRISLKGKGKGKSVPLQAWSGPEGSRKLRFPDFMTTVQKGGKVVNHTHRPHLPPRNSPGTHSVRG